MGVLGEIPARTTMRAYYHLEDVNDASGNGRTLANGNSVPFNAAKFNFGADFGTSGTNKRLVLNTNPMSALTYADATFSMWVKFNNSSSANLGAGIFDLVTRLTSGTGASRVRASYSISGGNFVVNWVIFLDVTNASINYSIPVNTTNWYNFVFIKSGTTTALMYVNGVLVNSNTGSGSDENNILSGAILYIGNGGSAGANGVRQGWVTIDEFIIEERVWSPSEIRKYYSQANGRFAAQ